MNWTRTHETPIPPHVKVTVMDLRGNEHKGKLIPPDLWIRDEDMKYLCPVTRVSYWRLAE